jgi:pyrroloquinoline quinone (PQQ) biosynthesis protein C
VEHFRSPFGPGDLASARAVNNRKFVDDLIHRARRHRFFAHPFLSAFNRITPPRDLVSFVLTSFQQIVAPFTGLLCALASRAPDLRTRFALMDNLYEEMGRGHLDQAHPSLYARMLASIGVPADAASRMPELRATRQINEHLEEVVAHRPFSVACAVLASAESTIPASFPVLGNMARGAFPAADLTFFSRHGARDEGHASDAATLFAVTGDEAHFASAETAVNVDLEHRRELLDEWMLRLRR